MQLAMQARHLLLKIPIGQAREAESFADKYRDNAHNNMKSSLMECKMQSEKLGFDCHGNHDQWQQPISTNNICGVIFFRDPLSAHPHHPTVIDPQSGEAILDYLLSGKAEQQTISNQVLETYQRGQSQVIVDPGLIRFDRVRIGAECSCND